MESMAWQGEHDQGKQGRFRLHHLPLWLMVPGHTAKKHTDIWAGRTARVCAQDRFCECARWAVAARIRHVWDVYRFALVNKCVCTIGPYQFVVGACGVPEPGRGCTHLGCIIYTARTYALIHMHARAHACTLKYACMHIDTTWAVCNQGRLWA